MSQVNVVCSSPYHSQTVGQPGHQDVLGTADRAVSGMVCQACANYAAALPPTQARAEADLLLPLVTAELMLLRAVALAAVGQLNVLRDWLMSFQAAVAASTSLSNLQTRVAALSSLPDISNAAALAAVQARVDGGDAD